jgi:hypothetical protein
MGTRRPGGRRRVRDKGQRLHLRRRAWHRSQPARDRTPQDGRWNLGHRTSAGLPVLRGVSHTCSASGPRRAPSACAPTSTPAGLIRLRRGSRALRSRSIDIIHAPDDARVLAFVRSGGTTRELVIASLNNRPFSGGYTVQTTAERLPPGGWQEVFNSDSAFYGGTDLGNYGATLPSQDGRIELRLPANGLIVLRRI